jgi:type I restriction enzyme M protein
MNMILHGATTAEIAPGGHSTLAGPHFLASGEERRLGGNGLKTFDYVVANPPFSTSAWRNGFEPEHDEYRRFEHGKGES